MFAQSINDLGNWFSSLKRYDMAEECYAIAYKKGNCPVSLFNRGSMLSDIYIKYSKAESKKHVNDLIEGKEIEKDENDEIENANQLNKLRKAEKLLLKYIEICPNDNDGYMCMSKIYESLSDYDKARQYRILSFNHGDFYMINRILVFTSTNGNLAEIAYKMFVKLFKHNDKSYYLNENKEVSVDKPDDMCGWTERKLTDEQIKEIDGQVVNSLGMKFYAGTCGVKLDSKKSHKLFKMALRKDYSLSYYNVGTDYLHGEGIDYINREKYKRKALKLFEIGAQKDCSACYRELGRIYDPNSKIESYSFHGIIDKSEEKSIMYHKTAAEKKDWMSCLEMIKYLQKTEGKKLSSSKKMYYNDDISKKQMLYLFDYMSASESGYDTPMNVEVPFNVLEHMKTLITYKMKKLKKKIQELELRPPEEGGRLYLEASKSFNENVKKM